jgi:hypothetical protein
MRIQETDRILKEARYARHDARVHERRAGVLARVWKALKRLAMKGVAPSLFSFSSSRREK